LPEILIVQVCSVFHQFLPMEKHFTYAAAFKRKVILCAEKTGNHAAGKKYTVRHVYIIGDVQKQNCFHV
jgi:hypothetical protein